MRLPCGCTFGRIRGQVLLYFIRTGRPKLFDIVHGGVNRKQARYGKRA